MQPRLLWALSVVALLGVTSCHRRSREPSVDGGASASLLGGERGLDHVGVAVRDLDETTRTYRDLLGFSRPTEGRLPNGIKNVNYYFGDSTYLETLSTWDPAKASSIAAFTEKHEGGLFAVLAASSPEATASYLRVRGVEVGPPYSGTIQTAGDDAMPEEKWKTFFLPNGLLPGDPLYFISYARPSREEFLHKLEDPKVRRQFHHKNTAQGLRAVWIAVRDMESATRAYERIGLVSGATFSDPALGARGQVFKAGEGEVWLLAPDSGDGEVAAFLRERDAGGVIGVTVQAGSVAIAAEGISERAHITLAPYRGVRGTSIRVAPSLTHGVWIEFSER